MDCVAGVPDRDPGASMNLGRIFAQAVARRVAYVVVGLVLLALASIFGAGEARAQTAYVCNANPSPCTREQAYDEAERRRQERITVDGFLPHQVRVRLVGAVYMVEHATDGSGLNWTTTGNPNGFRWNGAGCPAGSVWDDTYKNCNSCGTQQPTLTGDPPPNGTITCQVSNKPGQYCALHWHYNGDGTSTGTSQGGQCKPADFPEECSLIEGYYWHPLGAGSCRPIEPQECPEGQELGPDGLCKPPVCPEGMVSNALGICEPDKQQCPPGKERGPDGSCVGDTSCGVGQVKGPDGTCKPDADGDGEADEGENSFSGGDDCNVPPTCSGDPIMCGQARIQWRTECHLRRDYSITGGHCDAVPVCTGRGCNAMEYAQLLQQWKASCALEAIAQGGGGTPGQPGNGDANGNGIPDVLEQEGTHIEVEQGEVGTGPDVWGQVDTGGWLGGGACPGIPDVLGPQLGAMACQQGSYIQWLMRLLAVVTAAIIIGRAASGSAA